jgi:hypothetical protein
MALVKLTPKMLKALTNWAACNDFLRTASEKEAATLLRHERRGKQRTQYMLRMHSRFNHERAQRERTELFSAESKIGE